MDGETGGNCKGNDFGGVWADITMLNMREKFSIPVIPLFFKDEPNSFQGRREQIYWGVKGLYVPFFPFISLLPFFWTKWPIIFIMSS